MYSDPIIVENPETKNLYNFPEYLKDEPPFKPPEVPGNKLEIDPITIVPRAAWGARPATSQLPLHHPVTKIKFTSEDVYKRDEHLTKALLMTQEYYMDELKEPDVPFNFLVDEGGLVYEGRGWNARPRFTLKGENVLEIAFLGNYDGPFDVPTYAKCNAAHALIVKGIHEHLIDPQVDILSLKDRSNYSQEAMKWFPTSDQRPFADIKPLDDL